MYAGFWLRFLAYLIDWVVLFFSYVLFIFIWGGFGLLLAAIGLSQSTQKIILGVLGLPLYFAIPLLYHALFESSKLKGTIGKLAFGLAVVDRNNNGISFGRATGRYLGKIISSFTLLIGFILAGLTEKKQALHDFIASTYVIKKSALKS